MATQNKRAKEIGGNPCEIYEIEPPVSGNVSGSSGSAGFSSANINQGTGRKRKNSQNYEVSAETEVEQDTFAFLWSIKNFSHYSESEAIESPEFVGGPKGRHSWNIKVNRKKGADGEDYMAVNLTLARLNGKNEDIKVRFQISLINAFDTPQKQAGSLSMTALKFGTGTTAGFDEFIPTKQLATLRKNLLLGDNLSIHCRIWIEGKVKHTVRNLLGAAMTADEKRSRRKENLSTDFKTLRTTGIYADIAISTATRTFMCHKAVLQSRSSVFRERFMMNPAETTVEIEDFEENIVNAMLQYIYCGEYDDTLGDKTVDLMRLAETYQLSELKEDCENAITPTINLENVAELLYFANNYNATTLKAVAITYITLNADAVKKTKTFREFAIKNPAMFLDLILSA